MDFSQVVALVVTTRGEDGETLIGAGCYARDGMRSVEAELAFTTDGNYRGVGILRVAREAGDRGSRQMFSRIISLCLPSFGTAACQCNFGGTVASCT